MIGRAYPVGTKIRYRNGYIKVKIDNPEGDGVKWEAESRRMWAMYRGELEEGDRIFHIDGNRENNKISNLALIHFNQTKFSLYKESKVLYMPSVKHDSILVPRIKTLDKRTGRVLVNS